VIPVGNRQCRIEPIVEKQFLVLDVTCRNQRESGNFFAMVRKEMQRTSRAGHFVRHKLLLARKSHGHRKHVGSGAGRRMVHKRANCERIAESVDSGAGAAGTRSESARQGLSLQRLLPRESFSENQWRKELKLSLCTVLTGPSAARQ
jgi:hypothetical protein